MRYYSIGHPTDAISQLSAQGYVPHTELYSGLWSNVRREPPLFGEKQCFAHTFL